MSNLMSNLMSNRDVCRTAPATPGLLNKGVCRTAAATPGLLMSDIVQKNFFAYWYMMVI